MPTLFPTDSSVLTIEDVPLAPSLDDTLAQDDGTVPTVSAPRRPNFIPFDDLSETSSDSDDSTPAYTMQDHDKDLSRGMGHHLRLPVPVLTPGLKRRHPRTTSDSSLLMPEVPPVSPSPVLPSSVPAPDPAPVTLVLRPRRSARSPTTQVPWIGDQKMDGGDSDAASPRGHLG